MNTDRHRLIAARTRVLFEPTDSRYDAVSYEVIRQGAVEVSGDFPTMRLRRGSVIARPPGSPSRISPRGAGATVSVLLVDPELLIDTLAWQHAHEYETGHAGAAAILRARCTGPVYGAQLDEPAIQRLEPPLDSLVAVSTGALGTNFHRETSLLLQVLAEVIPALEHGLVSRRSRDGTGPGASLRPVRAEMTVVARLIDADLARPWTTAELARVAGLSSNQLRRVFSATFGRTPQRYQTVRRVERLKELLHDASLDVSEAILRAGWATPGNGARRFRQATGLSPREYRRRLRLGTPASASGHGRPASIENPAIPAPAGIPPTDDNCARGSRA